MHAKPVPYWSVWPLPVAVPLLLMGSTGCLPCAVNPLRALIHSVDPLQWGGGPEPSSSRLGQAQRDPLPLLAPPPLPPPSDLSYQRGWEVGLPLGWSRVVPDYSGNVLFTTRESLYPKPLFSLGCQLSGLSSH